MTETGCVVLVVEDEAPLRKFIRASLTSHGYRIIEADRASEVAMLVTSNNPEIVLMDLGLPDGDGLELTQRLREWTRIPIIVISARGHEADKVAALDAGADDYLTKPFGVNELLARMRVALRHAGGVATSPTFAQTFEFGDLKIDLTRRLVSIGGAEVHLTPTEYKLLVLLAQNAGRVLTHRHLVTQIWGSTYAMPTHNVRVHMADLRRKIDGDPSRQRLIITEPGVGYRLRDGG
jgi:two-component system, OmpR family, KDP operon response regulator KdpE